jgi:hypothetical protein
MHPKAAEELRLRCEAAGLCSLALNIMGLPTDKLSSFVSRFSPAEDLVLIHRVPIIGYRPDPTPMFTFGREPLDPQLYLS